MAIIPRFISKTNVTPAFSDAHMDPNTAAAPYRAAEQSTAHVFDVIGSELSAWDKTIKAKQAEQQAAAAKQTKVAEGIYLAEASAKMAMGAKDIQMNAQKMANGTNDVAGIGDQEYQKLADSVLANAPSDTARVSALKKILHGRSKLYSGLSDYSIKANNQINMDKMEGILNAYEAAAFTNPTEAEALKGESAQVFETMKTLGIPEHQVERIRSEFSRNLDFKSASSIAEKSPFEFKTALESGAYNHLGPAAIKQLANTMKHSLNATSKQASAALDDVEKQLSLGRPLPADFADRAALAEKAGLTTHLEDIARLSQVSASLGGKTLMELRGTSAELKALLNSGQYEGDAKRAEKLTKFVDERVKSLQKDPFGYAINQGAFSSFGVLTNLNDLTPELAQQRQYRALQVKSAYGVDSPALTADEIKVAAEQIRSSEGPDQILAMSTLNKLGPTTVAAVADELKYKDKGFAQAVRISAINPSAAEQIMEGRRALSNGIGKIKSSDFNVEVTNTLGTFAGDVTMRAGMLEAGKAYYAAKQAQGASISMTEALQEANNLVSVDRSGLFSGSYQTIAPGPGMNSDGFTSFLDSGLSSLSSWKDLGNGLPTKTAGGKPIQLNRTKPSDFDYIALPNGKYGVAYEGELVYTKDDSPLEVDLVSLYNK